MSLLKQKDAELKMEDLYLLFDDCEEFQDLSSILGEGYLSADSASTASDSPRLAVTTGNDISCGDASASGSELSQSGQATSIQPAFSTATESSVIPGTKRRTESELSSSSDAHSATTGKKCKIATDVPPNVRSLSGKIKTFEEKIRDPRLRQAMQYSKDITDAFNEGSWKNLGLAIHRICRPDCILRSHVTHIQTAATFQDTVLHGDEEILKMFKNVSESFPDAVWTVEGSKLRKGSSRIIVASKFSFIGTLINAVYALKFNAQQSLSVPTPLTTERVKSVGTFLLTLDTDFKVVEFDINYITDVRPTAAAFNST